MATLPLHRNKSAAACSLDCGIEPAPKGAAALFEVKAAAAEAAAKILQAGGAAIAATVAAAMLGEAGEAGEAGAAGEPGAAAAAPGVSAGSRLSGTARKRGALMAMGTADEPDAKRSAADMERSAAWLP